MLLVLICLYKKVKHLFAKQTTQAQQKIAFHTSYQPHDQRVILTSCLLLCCQILRCFLILDNLPYFLLRNGVKLFRRKLISWLIKQYADLCS